MDLSSNQNNLSKDLVDTLKSQNQQTPLKNTFRSKIGQLIIAVSIAGIILALLIYQFALKENKSKNNQQNTQIQPTINLSNASSVPIELKVPENSIEVRGTAMSPKFQNGSYYAIDRIFYKSNLPKRSDVALVQIGSVNGNIETIKRVIGIPGDRLQINGGSVYINGIKLDEPYVLQGTPTQLMQNGFLNEGEIITIPTDKYFVLGDNRDHSSDSRDMGLIPLQNIIGKIGECILGCSEKKNTSDTNFVSGENVK